MKAFYAALALSVTCSFATSACSDDSSSSNEDGDVAIAELRLMADTVAIGSRCTVEEIPSSAGASTWQTKKKAPDALEIPLQIEATSAKANRFAEGDDDYWVFEGKNLEGSGTLRWTVNEKTGTTTEFRKAANGMTLTLSDCL